MVKRLLRLMEVGRTLRRDALAGVVHLITTLLKHATDARLNHHCTVGFDFRFSLRHQNQMHQRNDLK